RRGRSRAAAPGSSSSRKPVSRVRRSAASSSRTRRSPRSIASERCKPCGRRARRRSRASLSCARTEGRSRPACRRRSSRFRGNGDRLAGRAVLHVFAGGYLGLSRVEGGVVNLAALVTPALAKEAHHDFDVLLTRLCEGSAALAEDLDGLTPELGPVLLSEP